jgi:amino acid transporter
MGWNYALNWLVCLPFELTAASLTIKFWDSSINITVWITVFFTLVIAANMFGVLGYGEVEFFLSTIKIVAIIGFIILGVIINCGGVPTDDRGYIGGRYWQDPGAFANGFKGFCSVFVSASFAYGGIETVGLAAAESANPRRTVPKATKQVIWRISLFYVISLSILGLIVPSNAKVLPGATGAQTKASPFVLAINMAGIKVLPSIFNAVITVSVMSVGTSSTYASTRTIQALCSQGMGPECLNYVDRAGRPFALVIALAFGLLAYINAGSTEGGFFDWLLALGGLSNFFTWGSICLAHIRFRAAWGKSGRALDELPYQASMLTPRLPVAASQARSASSLPPLICL